MEKKNELYYDAMDYLSEGEPGTAKKLLLQALKIDCEFVDAYVGLVAVYRETGNLKQEKESVDAGFDITKRRFPKWPKEMEWGILENRPYMRSICDKATTSQISGDIEMAEELYRLLLIMNPNDNQGVRYLIAGMFVGLGPEGVDDLMDECNEKQNWSKLEKLVDEQNKIHRFWQKMQT